MKSKIVQTDCIAGLSGLKEQVSVIVTSPPYNIGLDYKGTSDQKTDYLEWMQAVFASCKTSLSDHGHFFLQMGGIATDPLIPQRVLERALCAGFVLQNEIVWVKSLSVADKTYGHFKPINSKRYLNRSHEFIFHLTKKGDVPVDRLAVGVPFVYESNIKRFKGNKGNLRCRGNVWFIPYDTIQSKADRHDHPAVFPVMLPEMCIKLAGVPKGSLVVDPFVGIGTTLVACEHLGMRGLGFDISPEYCKIAEARLAVQFVKIKIAVETT